MKPQTRLVYDAMMRGEVLTNQTSKQLYGVEALSQRCGEITRDSSVPEVVSSKRVHGKPYNKHWISGAARLLATRPIRFSKPVKVSAHTRKAPVRCESTMELFA